MDIELKLRELLLPVLGLDSIEEVKPENSLVEDLYTDSIDFVELIYLIEQHFGVVLKTDELIAAGEDTGTLFVDDKLTAQGAALIAANLPGSRDRYKQGMTKIDLFSALTVGDLARVIRLKMSGGKGK